MVTRRSFILGSLGGLAALYTARAGLLVPATPALAAPAAADGNPRWEARHDLSAGEYQALFDQKAAQGWRLIDVSGYESGGQARYAAIWEQTAGPDWAARHGLSAQAHQAAFDDLSRQGFRPVRVNGYRVGAAAQFASIWHRAGGPAWQARHGLPAGDYQAEFDRLVRAGWRLVDVSGYEEGGQTKYTTVWEQSGGDWVARHGLSSDAYQTSFNDLSGKGYRLVRVSGHQSGGRPTYAAIWERSGGTPWQARHGIPAAQYQRVFNEIDDAGYRPVQVAGYAVGGGTQFAGIWKRPRVGDTEPREICEVVHRFMDNNNVPGLSLAITRNERLVYALNFGYADTAMETPVTRSSLFRIASLSKPITSAAIYHLIESGRLALTDTVFGVNGVLGTAYGTQPYVNAANNTNVEAITIQHLLEHTEGPGWSNAAGSDPMFQQNALSMDDLIDWVLDNRAVGATPGTTYNYSNFGYCVLGRVIERLSGQSYEAYVRQNVLTPAGITAMTIAGNTLAQRKAGEVVYYDQNGDNPYGMNVTRMDAHGGWLASAVDLARFIVRIDGLAAKPDLLRAATITTMTTGSAANPGYASGWGVSGGNWNHLGGLPGTATAMARRADGISWVVLANTERVSGGSRLEGALPGLMNDVLAKVKEWPGGDLF